MVLPLRLVTLNAYLISQVFNQNRVTHPEQRASRIQRFLQVHDLCFLQEVWGVGLAQLTIPLLMAKDENDEYLLGKKSILEPFQVPLWRNAFLGRWLANSSWSEFIYTVMFRGILQTGGLYDMVRPTTAQCVYRSKHTFSQSRSKSLKGVEATLWTNIAAWDYRYDLLVFNTHLDPWVPENRQQQVNEIIDFMTTTIHRIDSLPNRQKRNEWSTTGVLVVGDFNVKADTEEYETLFMNRLWKDCMAIASSKETSSNSIVLEQHTYDKCNSFVTCPEDCGRIDYIFMVDALKGTNFLPLQCLTCHTCRQAHGDELSDHYPIVAQIIPSTGR